MPKWATRSGPVGGILAVLVPVAVLTASAAGIKLSQDELRIAFAVELALIAVLVLWLFLGGFQDLVALIRRGWFNQRGVVAVIPPTGISAPELPQVVGPERYEPSWVPTWNGFRRDRQ